jgi:hypothetical protein
MSVFLLLTPDRKHFLLEYGNSQRVRSLGKREEQGLDQLDSLLSTMEPLVFYLSVRLILP